MKGYLENIPTIKNELINAGFFNKTLINSILAVIGKESNFNYRRIRRNGEGNYQLVQYESI